MYVVVASLFFEGYCTVAVHVMLRYSGLLCDESVEHILVGKAIRERKQYFTQCLM